MAKVALPAGAMKRPSNLSRKVNTSTGRNREKEREREREREIKKEIER